MKPATTRLTSLALAMAAASMAAPAMAIPIAADVVAVVDESGSMAGEHAWLGGMITSLESGLIANGVGSGATPNRYGLTGYGGSSSHLNPHMHLVGGSALGPAANFGAAAGTLVTNGGTEDGWRGISYALNNYNFNANSAVNIILVTDEDRDNTDASITYNSVLGDLTRKNALLNAVVDASFTCDAGAALGIDSKGNGYVADGSGGFNLCANGTATGGFGSTIADYVNLALASGGAAWDLNQLRAGGTTATSFTNALINIKVQEISNQPPTGSVPEPATLALLGAGLLGATATRKKAKQAR